jgi:hypothetical protein
MAKSTVALALAPLIGTDVVHWHADVPSYAVRALLYARFDSVISQVPSMVIMTFGAQRA